MRLHEIFDKPYELEWDSSDPGKIMASFTTGSRNEIGVMFIRFGDVWDVSFFFMKAGQMVYSLTGNGDAPKTLGTVVKAIIEFADRYDPQYLFFSSQDHSSSRGKLYAAMISKLLRDDHMELVKDLKDPSIPRAVRAHARSISPTHKAFLLRKKQVLQELFDNPYTVQWDDSDPREVTATFKTAQGNEITVMFLEIIRGHDLWEVSFIIEHKTETGAYQRTYSISHTGDAPRVFATVTAVIEDFVQKMHPDYLYFSSKVSEPSRIKLYDAMVKRAIKTIGGFHLITNLKDVPSEVANYVISNATDFKGWLFST